jgi:hypothetical protein
VLALSQARLSPLLLTKRCPLVGPVCPLSGNGALPAQSQVLTDIHDHVDPQEKDAFLRETAASVATVLTPQLHASAGAVLQVLHLSQLHYRVAHQS